MTQISGHITYFDLRRAILMSPPAPAKTVRQRPDEIAAHEYFLAFISFDLKAFNSRREISMDLESPSSRPASDLSRFLSFLNSFVLTFAPSRRLKHLLIFSIPIKSLVVKEKVLFDSQCQHALRLSSKRLIS